MVTLASGTIVAASLASTCFALLNRPGWRMAFIAIVDAVLLITIGLSETVEGLRAPAAYKIELGEYLQIPGIVAVFIIGSLFCLPLVLSIVWSDTAAAMLGRALSTDPMFTSQETGGGGRRQ